MSLGGPCLTVAVVSSLAAGSPVRADVNCITNLRFFMCGYSVEAGLSDDETVVAVVDDFDVVNNAAS